ncbi:hypothetical protein MFLO_12416 [Listeria floridensis FSL S10-1187]|uniref:Lipoprotein n=1 Tax=Listeria floridensis FSL S10-1187 TaxID=1265817 RepID=A0ABP3AVM7_9LIST|nr:hypothetical protein [Listeria floridensis]EUJ28200.1 hypothetical protein MFLO_12416 [Listeria floridensis FSL S10-1187]
MKKGLFLSVLLVFMLVLTACGSKTPQEKFVDTYSKQTEQPEQVTQKTSFKVDSFESDDLAAEEAAVIELLKQMQISATTSIDSKAEKTAVNLKLASKGSFKMNTELDFLSNDKTGEVFIPLKKVLNPDENTAALFDQFTNGVFSEIGTDYPDLKNKYLSTKEIMKLSGEEETTKTSDKVVKATKNLQKEVNKMVTDYLNDLDEKRYTEDKDGVVKVDLTNKDFVKLLEKAQKLLNKDSVKKDVKTIVTSQTEVTDFDEEYSDLKTSLKDATASFEKNKTVKINMPISMKVNKKDEMESMTMKINIDNTKDKDAAFKLGATLKLENKDFVKIPSFPKASEVVKSDELQTIIQEVSLKMMYGDDYKDIQAQLEEDTDNL